MKKLILLAVVLAFLSGCAAQTYRTARANANMVKNGMTVAQAAGILGMPPTHTTDTLVQWRRGNAQVYTATPAGAIEFHLVDGKIVDVPPGGIFGPAALAERGRRLALEAEERRIAAEAADAEKAKRDAAAEQARKEKEEREEAQRVKDIAAELEAAEKSIVICRDGNTCKKVFALAQIYVQRHSDQKIQVATDTIIETYNPTEDGKVAIVVTKMPRAGSVEVVKISPSCKDDKGHYERLCRLQRTQIYQGFKPFIERSLSM